MARLWRLLYALPVALALLIGSAWDRDDETNPLERTIRVGPSCLSFWPVPGACLFGLTGVTSVVSSAYLYEASLLDWEAPAADLDYMLSYATTEDVRLPGASTYLYLGAIYVSGSGYVMRFLTPTGHHFALLHMSRAYLAGPVSVAPASGTITAQPRRVSGDELTALRVGSVKHLPRSAARYVAGGAVVGRSGWPSSLQYSNNSCDSAYSCQSDSHLCILLSDGARQWFFYVAAGNDRKIVPRRARFPHTKWGRTPYKDRHGHLIWSAAWSWRHHQTWLYPHVRGDRWYGHARGRRYGYMDYRFRYGHLRCWPHWRTCKASKR